MTLIEWIDLWSERRSLDPYFRSSHDERLIIAVRIRPDPIAEIPLTALRPRDVQAWTERLLRSRRGDGRPYARQTLKNALNTLRVALRDAVREGLIDMNPAAEIRIRRLPQTWDGPQVLSLAEIDRLTRCADIPLDRKLAILTALYTGVRAGELWGLQWNDIARDWKSAAIRRSFAGPTKTGVHRTVPLLAPAERALRTAHAIRNPNTDVVFAGRGGRPHARGYDAGLAACLKLAGIRRHIRFHDLRHTCASHLISGSWGRVWSTGEVAAFLGHSSQRTTERYAHMLMSGLMDAARATAQVR